MVFQKRQDFLESAVAMGINKCQPIDIVIPESAKGAAIDILADMGLINLD